jgi:hypothetical protein
VILLTFQPELRARCPYHPHPSILEHIFDQYCPVYIMQSPFLYLFFFFITCIISWILCPWDYCLPCDHVLGYPIQKKQTCILHSWAQYYNEILLPHINIGTHIRPILSSLHNAESISLFIFLLFCSIVPSTEIKNGWR